MAKKYLLILFCLPLCVLGVSAQQVLGSGDDEDETTEEIGEYKGTRLGYYKVYGDNLDTFQVDVDTALHAFHIYNPMFQHTMSATNLGNLGSPYVSNLYFDRVEEDFLFADVYSAFMKVPSNLPIVNTRTPFSVLSYGNGGPKQYAEETLSGIFSQNVNPYFNFGVYFDIIYARGRYTNTSTRHKNYGLFSSYMSPRYNMYFNYGSATMENKENGGIGDANGWIDDYINNPGEVTDEMGAKQPENYPTRMSGESFYRRRFWTMSQNYNIGVLREVELPDSIATDTVITEFVSALRLVHKFSMETDIKQYQDKIGQSSFYDTAYIHPTLTNDSLWRRKISNRLGLYLDEDINRFGRFGAGAYIQSDYHNIQNNPWTTLEDSTLFKGYAGRQAYIDESTAYTAATKDLIAEAAALEAEERSLTAAEQLIIEEAALATAQKAVYAKEVKYINSMIVDSVIDDEINDYEGYTYNNITFGGSIFKRTGKHFFFEGAGHVVMSGYNAGDWGMSGSMRQAFSKLGQLELSARANFARKTPDYFTNHYYANNYWWNNDFDPVFKQELGGTLKIPAVNFEVSLDIDNMQNLVFFNEYAMPEQYDGNLAVMAFRLKKDFEIGRHLRWDNDIVYQETSASYALPLPQITAYTNLMYKNVLFKVLHFELGVDCRFHTAYKAPGYMPATGRFYNQQDVEIGNYPYMSAYANFFLRRMRFFLMSQHVNHGWPSLEYFSAPHYGYNHRMFKMGLQWTFYD